MWEEDLFADRPVVCEPIVDAGVPPMPSHIILDRAKAMTRVLYRGDPAAPEILRHAFAELVEEYIPPLKGGERVTSASWMEGGDHE